MVLALDQHLHSEAWPDWVERQKVEHDMVEQKSCFAPKRFNKSVASHIKILFEQESCFAPQKFEQKCCFAPKMFEQKSYFAPKMFEQ